MALDTYDNLKTAIAGWLDNDELNLMIDDFIDLAEAAHRDEVRFREILERGTLTLAADSRTVALPSDFARMKYIRLLNPTSGTSKRYLPALTQMSEHELTAVSTNDKEMPKYFCCEDRIEFDSEADQEYTGDILYYKVMTPLSDVNPSNELLVRSPGLYLYGALLESAPYLMNDERIKTWEKMYEKNLARLNGEERQNRRSGPQVARVKGV